MSKGDIIFIVPDYLKQYNPQFISFFGSYARKEQNTTSNIDILAAFHKSMFYYVLTKFRNIKKI